MKNYDPKDVAIVFKGQLITGIMSGTFVSVERNEDSYEKTSGAGGDITRVRKNDKSGMVTVTLQSESPSNAVFDAAHLQDELTNLGSGNIEVTNVNSTGSATAAEAWVQKPAKVEYSDGATGREWKIECAVLSLLNGFAVN